MEAAARPSRMSLALELTALERDECDLSALRRRLHEHIDRDFANTALLLAERDVSRRRRAAHAAIDRLRAQLDRDRPGGSR